MWRYWRCWVTVRASAIAYNVVSTGVLRWLVRIGRRYVFVPPYPLLVRLVVKIMRHDAIDDVRLGHSSGDIAEECLSEHVRKKN